uniref:Arsenite methyltransferase n=1 Tax=Neolamprologus brichardi TaxID=32507 RepID=A0A3Q4MQR5_NEOBR
MRTAVNVAVQKYYGKRLESSGDLQTGAASCGSSCRPAPRSVTEALSEVHPEVTKRFFGCGLPFPAKLEGCRVLDLGSGSGRDCYAFSKLVGPNGHVTGIDMTQELVITALQYVQYHQDKFGYKEPNVTFVQGYMENLNEAGIQSDSMDVIQLCYPDESLLTQRNEGGELYFSDMFASKIIPDHMKQDAVLWGDGRLSVLAQSNLIGPQRGFQLSTPRLSEPHCALHFVGDISYASGTYRLFKLPRSPAMSNATVTYKGTLAEFPDQLDFDSSHCFKKDVSVQVNGEMAAILQSSRFSSDFKIQMLDKQDYDINIVLSSQYCHLNPFLLADKLGSSVKQCSKTSK